MMTDLAQLNSIKGICCRVFVYYNTLKSQKKKKMRTFIKGTSLKIIFRNILLFLDSLEIFYEKIINN